MNKAAELGQEAIRVVTAWNPDKLMAHAQGRIVVHWAATYGMVEVLRALMAGRPMLLCARDLVSLFCHTRVS